MCGTPASKGGRGSRTTTRSPFTDHVTRNRIVAFRGGFELTTTPTASAPRGMYVGIERTFCVGRRGRKPFDPNTVLSLVTTAQGPSHRQISRESCVKQRDNAQARCEVESAFQNRSVSRRTPKHPPEYDGAFTHPYSRFVWNWKRFEHSFTFVIQTPHAPHIRQKWTHCHSDKFDASRRTRRTR